MLLHFSVTPDVVVMCCVNFLRWLLVSTLALIKVIYLWQCKVCSDKTMLVIEIKYGLPKLLGLSTQVKLIHFMPTRWSALWEIRLMSLSQMLMKVILLVIVWSPQKNINLTFQTGGRILWTNQLLGCNFIIPKSNKLCQKRSQLSLYATKILSLVLKNLWESSVAFFLESLLMI